MTVFYQGKAERKSLKFSDLKTVSSVSKVRCLDNLKVLTVASRVGHFKSISNFGGLFYSNLPNFQEIFIF